MSSFLLDTGLLLGFCRKAPYALNAREQYRLGDQATMVFTSVVCKGEILALQERLGWGESKRNLLQDVLSTIPAIGINDDLILDAYARIDAWSRGRPVVSPHNAPPPRSARKMAKNDLWIAATAHASQTVLLSTDKDFEHLRDIWCSFIYIDPQGASGR